MSNVDLWREVVDQAMKRKGNYDTQAITEEIEANYGPSSLREVPQEAIERLFQKHETLENLEPGEVQQIKRDLDE